MGGRRQLRLPQDDSAIERRLYRDSDTLRQAEQWVRRKIYGLSDEQARWLYDQYKEAYGRMLTHLSTAYGPDGKPYVVMRAQLLEQIEGEMLRLYAQVEGGLDSAFMDAYKQGLYGRAWALDMATRDDVIVSMPQRLPTEAIRASLLSTYGGKDWHEDLGYDRAEYVNRIKRSISQSLIQGEGMAAAQRRLRDELGIVTDRRKGFKRNFYRTLLIARTEIQRSANQGALALYERNQDVLSGWEWCATLSERTCAYCGGLDGKRFKFGDPMLVPPSGSHPGCRCTAVPVLMDTELMDRVAGVRELYGEWATRRGLADDGGLARQRGAAPSGVNET